MLSGVTTITHSLRGRARIGVVSNKTKPPQSLALHSLNPAAFTS